MGAVSSTSNDCYTVNGSSEPSIHTFHSTARWRAYFDSIRGSPKLIVIDFTATWCGPCRKIEPAFIELASKFTDVEFVKIDVDELMEVAQEFGVQAMPTFILIKQGMQVDKVVGANIEGLERKIEKHRVAVPQDKFMFVSVPRSVSQIKPAYYNY